MGFPANFYGLAFALGVCLFYTVPFTAPFGLPIILLNVLLEGLLDSLMGVVSVKIPKKVREKMKEYSGSVNWPEEIRRLITAKIEELERGRALEEAVKLLEGTRPTLRGTAKALVRENRDSH